MKLRWSAIGLIVLVVWSVFLAWWAFQPLVDHIPTGIVNNEHTTQAVVCGSPAGHPVGTSASLPPLGPHQTYERDACVLTEKDNRRLLIFDIVCTVIAFGLLGWRLSKKPLPPATPDPVLVSVPDDGNVVKEITSD
jgi:hypothetical protein